MPDITMCSGENCPLKEKCYRYKATPWCGQSYFVEIPYNHNENSCEYFWGKKRKEQINETS